MAAAIPEDRRILVDCSPVEVFKAAKNDVEIAGLRKSGILCGNQISGALDATCFP